MQNKDFEKKNYKRKKIKKENEKVANQKLGKVENLGKIIPSFLISEFLILPYSQNRKLGFKNLGKKFPRFLRFLRFPNFQPGLVKVTVSC